MNLGKVDYASPVPPKKYRCVDCGLHGVKLWREYQTMADGISLRCCDCAGNSQKHNVTDIDEDGRVLLAGSALQRCDQIGWLVPACPTAEGDTYWGYSSVPNAGVRWWKCLPNRAGEKPRNLPPADPEPVKPDYDSRWKQWQKETAYIVEATSSEHLELWNKWHKLSPGERDFSSPGSPKNAPWEQMNPGCLTTVGKLAKMPVAIDMSWARIHNQLVLFWHATSVVVDHRLIDKWFDKNVPSARRTTATNFHNCVYDLARKSA